MTGELPVVFDANYEDLPDDAQCVYRVLGVYPGHGFSAHLAAAGANIDLHDVERLLGELVRANLLIDDGEGYYQLHEFNRGQAHRLAEWHEPGKARVAALQRMVRWALQATRLAAEIIRPAWPLLPSTAAPSEPTFFVPEAISYHSVALGWLDRERRNLGTLVAAAAEHGWAELVVLLADAMQPLAILHPDFAHAVWIDEIALRAARHVNDVSAMVGILERLSRAHLGLGEFNAAEEHADDLMVLADQGDRTILSVALTARGAVVAADGRPEDATADFRESATILRELGDTRGECLVLHDLGDTLIMLGRCDEAAAVLGRSRDRMSSLDTLDRYDLARLDISLANALIHTGGAAAETLLGDALATMIDLDAPTQQARAHDVLAQRAASVGDERQATHHRKAAGAFQTPNWVRRLLNGEESLSGHISARFSKPGRLDPRIYRGLGKPTA